MSVRRRKGWGRVLILKELFCRNSTYICAF